MGLLLFSEIDVCAGDGSEAMSFYASGHPDQADVCELFARDPGFEKAAAIAGNGADIRVRHYAFQHTGNTDVIAEESHFAIIEAYDYLAEYAGAYDPFTWRPDVKRTADFAFRISDLKGGGNHA